MRKQLAFSMTFCCKGALPLRSEVARVEFCSIDGGQLITYHLEIEDEKSGGIVDSPQRANSKCQPEVYKAKEITIKASDIYL